MDLSVDAFTQILTQYIFPITSSPILWTLASTLGASIILHRTCVPCTTVRKLRLARSAVDILLASHNLMELVSGSSNLPLYNEIIVREYMDYQRHLLRIQQKIDDISVNECTAQKLPWKDYLSPTRVFNHVFTISLCYKDIRTLQRKIEHSKALSSKRRSDLMVQLHATEV
ncbi:hypothetical protein BT96DRAFT_1007188 [Gymnopus androsaceus JB14]|uniref:Uncharacterized protein n=1 Tax=Gymnopus androsaceus JB14 TaxID=1447944 RepID=A0A6A4GI03_9AGAR|nr:hypothetical protein BT96DRAFT_1007188 [Gymnopus androsaceus JB14]